MQVSTAWNKFTSHRHRCSDNVARVDAVGERIRFKLSFEEWCEIWESSGKWKLRGTGTGKYCMSRYNDLGHYEIGNVSIILAVQNTVDASIGRRFKHTDEAKAKISAAGLGSKRSEATKQKMRESALGVVCSDETKAKLSLHNKGKPMKRVKCTFCGFETSPQNMSRHVNASHNTQTQMS